LLFLVTRKIFGKREKISLGFIFYLTTYRCV
jgi:hypothetical protein